MQDGAESALLLASRNGHVHVVKTLLAVGASMFDQSPLVHATTKGHGAVVKVLLKFGARTESVNENGWTPLQIASSYGDFIDMKTSCS